MLEVVNVLSFEPQVLYKAFLEFYSHLLKLNLNLKVTTSYCHECHLGFTQVNIVLVQIISPSVRRFENGLLVSKIIKNKKNFVKYDE